MKSSQARRRIRRSGSSHERREQRAQQFFGCEPATPFFRPTASLQRAADDKKEPDAVQRAEDDKKKDETVQRAPEDEKKIERAAEEHKEEGGAVQRKELAGGRSPSLTHQYVQQLSGRGQPLSTGEQAFFGQRMGRDFSSVRVHTGGDASESARDVNAKAYTYGRHIVFNQGRYDSTSRAGKTLLAHELAHVVQQGNAPVLRLRNKPGRRGA